ncbi:MAG: Gfo/Idh/MocA family protein [Opitutaceae bacterium]
MRLPRRRFLSTCGAFAVSSVLCPSILSAQNRGPDKLRIAIIGAGGRGKAHVSGLAHEQIVAFCDVDDRRAADSYRRYPNVRRFKDYRVMLDEMGDQIDAVSIAIPDHMHYPVALWVIAHGKHVLVEKPLVRTFEEAMLLKQVAREAGVITQMGNQGHAGDGIRSIQEWVQAGVIGEVKEAYHWTNRPIWPQGMSETAPVSEVPMGLDWDLWQGVAPTRPYCEGIAPRNWRGYRDYGCGAIGDIACHSMDTTYTALKLGFPTRVSAVSDGMSDLAFPKSSEITFDFVSGLTGQPVRVNWLDGGRLPQEVPHVPKGFIEGLVTTSGREKLHPKPIDNGTFIVGSKGTIYTSMYGESPIVFPFDYIRQLKAEQQLPEKIIPRIEGGHFKEWTRCIKAGTQPGANIVDYAADFTATALLGAAALSVDGALDFDAETQSFTNNPSADQLLKSRYAYRKEFLPT